MIIYDLKCKEGHKFEGWFKDREAWLEQKSKNLVACPVCGGSDVEMLPPSLTIMGKDSRSADKMDAKNPTPTEALQLLQQYVASNFEDVGNRFAEVALKIHYGEEEKRNIRGTTTIQEEESLKEEGIQFVKIPLPKMDS